MTAAAPAAKPNRKPKHKPKNKPKMNTEQTQGGLRFNLPANPLQAMTGREPKTTFWQDFCIADMYGLKAIQDTYDRAFAEWKTNTEYITEFAVVLNHKIWYFYEAQQAELRRAREAAAQMEAATDRAEKEQHRTAAAAHSVRAQQLAEIGTLYDKLWKEADGWCMDNLTGKDIEYYLEFTD